MGAVVFCRVGIVSKPVPDPDYSFLRSADDPSGGWSALQAIPLLLRKMPAQGLRMLRPWNRLLRQTKTISSQGGSLQMSAPGQRSIE